MHSLNIAVIWDQESLNEIFGGFPPVLLSEAGFHIIEQGDQLLGLFLVQPDTMFIIDLPELVMNAIYKLETKLGVGLNTEFAVGVMRSVMLGSFQANKKAH